MNVAVLGLGIMGGGIAQNLLKAGFATSVYNRTAAKAAPLAQAGARVAASPREAAEGADVIVAMVGDDTASRAVWLGDQGALAGAKDGATLVECSTLSLDWVRELAAQAAGRGLALLDAPVTGSKDAAAAGQLKLLVGGPAEVLERARPVLAAFSTQIIHFGPSGAGATMKLVNNLQAAVQTAALAEGLALAERAGLDMGEVLALLTGGAPGSPIVKGKSAMMAAHSYADTNFALRWMHKDATYALRAADEFGVMMPTLAAARELYRLARSLGHDDEDFAVVYEALRLRTEQ